MTVFCQVKLFNPIHCQCCLFHIAAADDNFILNNIVAADKMYPVGNVPAQKKKIHAAPIAKRLSQTKPAKTQIAHIAVHAGSKQGMVRAPCPKRTKTAPAFFAVFARWAAAQTCLASSDRRPPASSSRAYSRLRCCNRTP